MAKKKAEVVVLIKNARLSFSSIFTAQENVDPETGKKGKPTFSAHAIIDREQAKEIMAKLKEVSNLKWRDKGAAVFKQLKANNKICLRNGETKTDEDGNVLDGYEGMYYVSARSQRRPTIVDRDRQELSEEDGKPYSGCYVNMQVSLWAQTGQFGKRLNAQLRGVQFVRDGEAFSSSVAKPSDFDDLADEFSDDDDSAFDEDDGDLV